MAKNIEQPESKKKPRANSDKRFGKKPTRLGRGLSALMAHPVPVDLPADSKKNLELPIRPVTESPDKAGLPRHATTANTPAAANPDQTSSSGLVYIPADAITANPHQPRQSFNEAALQRLADSIRTDGLMQPIIVRRVDQQPASAVGGPVGTGPERYELVAGERRWRAAQSAGLNQLPAIVRSLNDRQLAEWALIENLQREDLNPIERAEAFQHLIDQFQLSHDQIAQRVGSDRSTISNCLRLLHLCQDVRQLVQDGLLSAGQAKVLAAVSDTQQQQTLAQRAVAQGWTVRQLEQALRTAARSTGGLADPDSVKIVNKKSTHLRDLEKQLGDALKTRVKLRSGRKKGSGTLAIEFYSLDQFDELMHRMNVKVQMD